MICKFTPIFLFDTILRLIFLFYFSQQENPDANTVSGLRVAVTAAYEIVNTIMSVRISTNQNSVHDDVAGAGSAGPWLRFLQLLRVHVLHLPALELMTMMS